MQEITITTPEYLGCVDVRVTTEDDGQVHVSVKEHGQRVWERPETLNCRVETFSREPQKAQEPLRGFPVAKTG